MNSNGTELPGNATFCCYSNVNNSPLNNHSLATIRNTPIIYSEIQIRIKHSLERKRMGTTEAGSAEGQTAASGHEHSEAAVEAFLTNMAQEATACVNAANTVEPTAVQGQLAEPGSTSTGETAKGSAELRFVRSLWSTAPDHSSRRHAHRPGARGSCELNGRKVWTQRHHL